MSTIRTDSFNLSGFLQMDRVAPVTVEKMKKIEDEAVSRGISKTLMMENAGAAIAQKMRAVDQHHRRDA